MADHWGGHQGDVVTLAGAARLDRALAKLETDLNDGTIAKVAGELVLASAKSKSRSRRVRQSGTVKTRRGRAVVTFGGPKGPPFTVQSHFGHGSADNPRPQGGWMPKNTFVYDAAAEHEDDVVDLYLTGTGDRIRRLF